VCSVVGWRRKGQASKGGDDHHDEGDKARLGLWYTGSRVEGSGRGAGDC